MNYNTSTKQFSITTRTGSRLCLEVYWGDYCNLAPTPLVFYSCDASRPIQQWKQSGSQIFSMGQLHNGVRSFCMSSAKNMYYSQASVELAFESNSLQQWSFNWTSSYGNLRNAGTNNCLQLPAAAFYGTAEHITSLNSGRFAKQQLIKRFFEKVKCLLFFFEIPVAPGLFVPLTDRLKSEVKLLRLAVFMVNQMPIIYYLLIILLQYWY